MRFLRSGKKLTLLKTSVAQRGCLVGTLVNWRNEQIRTASGHILVHHPIDFFLFKKILTRGLSCEVDKREIEEYEKKIKSKA
jgi:hypothetical protein